MRASFLEKDNAMLKEELLTVKYVFKIIRVQRTQASAVLNLTNLFREELQSLREKLLLVTQQSELQLAKCQNNNCKSFAKYSRIRWTCDVLQSSSSTEIICYRMESVDKRRSRYSEGRNDRDHLEYCK